MKLSMYWNYATRSLIRGGQRTVLGIFCIAVGVMAIVALQLVGISVNNSLTSNVAEANGGDLRVSSSAIPFQAKDLQLFQDQKQQGNLTDYASAEDTGSEYTLDNGDAVPFDLLAISSNYPLVGDANFVQPSGASIKTIVSGSNAAFSQRLATAIHVKVGDAIDLVTGDGRIFHVTVAGIFQDGGSFQGTEAVITEQIFDSALLPNGKTVPPSYSVITVTAPAGKINGLKDAVSQQLPSANVQTVPDLLKQRQDQVALFRLFLQIVGLLALFIGGIGIINTIQVLLRRRQVEIAMLKTAGYRQSDLYALFGLETALLGLMGGVLGTAAGVGVSNLVRFVMSRSFFLHLDAVYDPTTIASGVFIGFATALIFGLLPIVQSSQVRPIAVLRGLTEEGQGASRWLTAGLLVLLSVLFVGLTATIVGDVVKATFIVYGGTGVIFGLALGFGLLVFAISRLPVFEVPSGRMLLWLLLALGVLVGGGLAGGILIGLGAAATAILGIIGQSGLGIYFSAVFGGLGLIIIGGSAVYFLAAIFNAIVMFLPRGAKTAVMLAYRNMGRQQVRTTMTLTALFVGVFAIGLVLILGQGIKDAINNTLNNFLPQNVFVLAAPQDIPQVKSALTAQGKDVDASKTTDNQLANAIPVSINGQDINSVLTSLPLKGFRDNKQVGRMGVQIELSSLQGYDLQGGASDAKLLPTVTLSGKPNAGRILNASDAGTNDVMLSDVLMLPPLSLVKDATIVVANQSQDPTKAIQMTLHVVGFYDSQSASSITFGTILADNGVVKAIGGDQIIEIVAAKVNVGAIPALRKALKTTAPRAGLLSITDVTQLINGVLNNLILMLTTISSLAMVAGLIIIANAVALAMLERRREIGILKSVGHTSGSILATVLLENGLVGFLGSLVAMLLVGSAIALLSAISGTNLGLGSVLIALVIGSTVVVTMLIAGLVAWTATRVRPLEVLRYE